MNTIIEWGKRHPTRVVALLALAVTTFAAYLPAVLGPFLGAALAIVIGKPLHDVVTPVSVAAANTAQAVTETATRVAVAVAENLDDTVVGEVGEVTAAAAAVAHTAAAVVAQDVLGRVA